MKLFIYSTNSSLTIIRVRIKFYVFFNHYKRKNLTSRLSVFKLKFNIRLVSKKKF